MIEQCRKHSTNWKSSMNINELPNHTWRRWSVERKEASNEQGKIQI